MRLHESLTVTMTKYAELHAREQCISVLSRYNNKQRHQNVNYVKESKAVLCKDLDDRFGLTSVVVLTYLRSTLQLT